MDQSQAQLSERHYRSIVQLIETRVGIQLPAAKRTMVEGRLRKRVRALGLQDLNSYASRLFEEDGLTAEFDHLVDCVTTNKTDFFREPAHFTFLQGARAGVTPCVSPSWEPTSRPASWHRRGGRSSRAT